MRVAAKSLTSWPCPCQSCAPLTMRIACDGLPERFQGLRAIVDHMAKQCPDCLQSF